MVLCQLTDRWILLDCRARRSHSLNAGLPVWPLPPTMKLTRVLFLAVVCSPLSLCSAQSDPASSSLTASASVPTTHSHHSHDPHKKPLQELDEAQVLKDHGSDPESYWDHDYLPTVVDAQTKSHPSLMVLHIVSMSLAFFGALPIGMVLVMYIL